MVKGVGKGVLKIVLIFGALFVLWKIAGGALAPADYRVFPLIGSRVLIWIFGELHLMFAAFVLGVPMFAVICEVAGALTKDKRYDHLAHEFTKLLALAFTITALLGAGMLLCLIFLYPKFLAAMTKVFHGTYPVYLSLVFAEVVYAYLYYYSWDTLQDSVSAKWTHILIGVLLNLAGTGLMFVADGWATFMMSPRGITQGGELTSLWQAVNNLTWMPINIHRLIANVAFGGFMVAAYGAFRYLGAQTPEERAHYDWMGYVGNFIGLCGMIPLPFAGYWLAREVYAFNETMGISMMGGIFSWLFIIQAILIGMLFVGANYYLWLAMERTPGGERYRNAVRYLLAALFVCFAVWLTPHTVIMTAKEMQRIGGAHHPLVGVFGVMSAKNTAVNIIILATFISFALYRRANKIKQRVAAEQSAVLGPLGVGLSLGFTTYLIAWSVPIIFAMTDVVRNKSAAMASPSVLSSHPVGYFFGALALGWAVMVLLWRALPAPVRFKLGNLAEMMTYGTAAFFVILLGIYGYYVPPLFRVEKLSPSQVGVVLSAMLISLIVTVFTERKSRKLGEPRWGEIPQRSQYALILLSVTITLLMGLMGYLRSALRQAYHIYGFLKDVSPDAFTPTLGFATKVIAVVVLLFYGFVVLVFWLGIRNEHGVS